MVELPVEYPPVALHQSPAAVTIPYEQHDSPRPSAQGVVGEAACRVEQHTNSQRCLDCRGQIRGKSTGNGAHMRHAQHRQQLAGAAKFHEQAACRGLRHAIVNIAGNTPTLALSGVALTATVRPSGRRPRRLQRSTTACILVFVRRTS